MADLREYLIFRQSKTGKVVNVRAPSVLRELRSVHRESECIVVNERGEECTRNGLQMNLGKLVTALAGEGLVEPGLCFHGLRHSLGTASYDLEVDREARKSALGHTSDAAGIVISNTGANKAKDVAAATK